MATINFANLTNYQTNSSFKNVNCTFRCRAENFGRDDGRAENFGRDDDWMMIWNDDILLVLHI